MDNKILSIVMPVFNEQNTIKEILSQVINAQLPDLWNREIIVINDNSTDNTLEILNNYQKDITLINRKTNGGKGSALRDGFAVVKGDYVIVQDADLEYKPSDYVKLLEPIIRDDADVVFGSRNMGQNNVSYGFFHYYGGMLLTKIFNFMFGSRLTDFSTCYKVFHKKYIPEMLKFKSNNFAFDVVEMTYLLAKNSKIIEVPISYNPRNKKQGKKLKIKDGISVFFVIIRTFIKNIHVKKNN